MRRWFALVLLVPAFAAYRWWLAGPAVGGRDAFWFTDRHGHSHTQGLWSEMTAGSCAVRPDGRRFVTEPGCLGPGPFTLKFDSLSMEGFKAEFGGKR